MANWLKDYDKNWMSNYDQIEYESDGQSDFYDESMSEGAYWDGYSRGSLLSNAWSRGRTKKTNSENIVRELREIRTSVHNLLKVHGIPRDCTVSLASMGGAGKGCAGFHDTENFAKPFILLDKAIYSEVPAEEVLDVYCGVALHEAGHILNTRQLFPVIEKASTESMQLWLNLLEDERIERIEKERSAGFAPYISASLRALFENKELGSAISNWEKSSEMDKVRTLMFCFLRTPHLLTDSMKEWRIMKGQHVYADLRELLKSMPKTELDVAQTAKELDLYYHSLIKDMDKLDDSDAEKSAGSGEGSGGDGTPSRRDMMEQMKQIRKHHSQYEDDKTDSDTDSSLREDETDSASGINEERDGVGDKSERTSESRTKSARKKREKLADSREDRFGELEIRRMLDRFGKVTEGLDIEESDILAKHERDRVSVHDSWNDEASGERKTVVTHPTPEGDNKSRYQLALNAVKDQVAKMRNVFRLRLGERKFSETELQEGRLHRRRIGLAKSTNRIFKRDYKVQAEGLSICLLLDESGSMGSVSRYELKEGELSNGRIQQALKTAVLITEALRNVPMVELEVYSYSSCGEYDKHNLVKYLYGKNNKNPSSVGNYSNGYQNYDHVALKTAGDLFKANTTNKNRLMLVLSDGSPYGHEYGGEWAVRKTKESVDNLERQGINVIQIAIDSFDSESMFKNVIRFLDLPDLINQMRRLITRVVRSAS